MDIKKRNDSNDILIKLVASILILVTISLILFLIFAGGEDKKPTKKPEEIENNDPYKDDEIVTTDGILLRADEESKVFSYYDIYKKEDVNVEFSGVSRFEDSYGKILPKAMIEPGTIVKITTNRTRGRLDKVALLADDSDIWEYRGVTGFRFVEVNDFGQIQMECIGEKFSCVNGMYIFDDGKRVQMDSLISSDHLTIRGIGTTIYEIVVTKGHGTLSLQNAEYFEGGYLSVGMVKEEKIQAGAVYTLPEGKYNVTVKKGKYSGTGVIEIKRNETACFDVGFFGPAIEVVEDNPASVEEKKKETGDVVKSNDENVPSARRISLKEKGINVTTDDSSEAHIWGDDGADIYINGDYLATINGDYLITEKILGDFVAVVSKNDENKVTRYKVYACKGEDNKETDQYDLFLDRE